MATDLTQVLYVDGAAALLQKTPKAVYADVARRRIPFKKLGGRVIFLRSELEEFIKNLPGVSVEEARENLAMRQGAAVTR